MKSYFSLTYLWIFLPLLMLLYQAVPQRHRWKVLLGGSYVFYWLISGRLIVFLLIGTGLAHWFGLWLTMVREEKAQALTQARKEDKKALKAGFQKKLRGILLLGVGLNLGLLVVLKYTRFFGTNVNSLLRILGLSFRFSIPEFLMPLEFPFTRWRLCPTSSMFTGAPSRRTEAWAGLPFIWASFLRSWRAPSAATARPLSSSGRENPSPITL